MCGCGPRDSGRLGYLTSGPRHYPLCTENRRAFLRAFATCSDHIPFLRSSRWSRLARGRGKTIRRGSRIICSHSYVRVHASGSCLHSASQGMDILLERPMMRNSKATATAVTMNWLDAEEFRSCHRRQKVHQMLVTIAGQRSKASSSAPVQLRYSSRNT